MTHGLWELSRTEATRGERPRSTRGLLSADIWQSESHDRLRRPPERLRSQHKHRAHDAARVPRAVRVRVHLLCAIRGSRTRSLRAFHCLQPDTRSALRAARPLPRCAVKRLRTSVLLHSPRAPRQSSPDASIAPNRSQIFSPAAPDGRPAPLTSIRLLTRTADADKHGRRCSRDIREPATRCEHARSAQADAGLQRGCSSLRRSARVRWLWILSE